uniref:30S ribosomal protein S21 n=1 Tax=Anthurium amnicola TaxID=1678845 RepID=A0A1D1YCC9_9ARAE
MAAPSVAASLRISLWPSGAKTAPPPPRRQLLLRPPSLRLSLSQNVGEGGGLRSRWWGLAQGPGGGPLPVVMAASGGNYNVQVVVGEDEPEQEVVRRFRGAVLRAGIIQECKRRRFFEDKQAERKRRVRESAKRNRRRRPRSRSVSSVDKKQDGSADDEGEEDNWELPGGEIPS